MIGGTTPTIRETTAADLADLGRLWNDGRVMRWVGFPDGLGYGEGDLQAWFDRLGSSRHEHHFVIRDTDLGFCGELFYRVDAEHRRAELDIKLLPEAQGRRIATVGLSWLIERVFEREPDVEAVWTEPTPENHASRALYARADSPRFAGPATFGRDRRTGRGDGPQARPDSRAPPESVRSPVPASA